MGSMNYAKYSAKRKDFVFGFVFANPFDEIIFYLKQMNEVGRASRSASASTPGTSRRSSRSSTWAC